MDDKTMKSVERVDRLAAARLVLMITGKSPRELGMLALGQVLEFVFRFGYTSAGNINLLLGRTKGGYAEKLVRQGYLCATKTKSGNPEKIYTLTELGLQEAVRNSEYLLRYSELDPYKINQQLIRHNLIAQKLTISALTSGVIRDYQTERMLDANGDMLNIKRPDVAWVGSQGLRIGVEIELSAKWERDLDHFVLEIIHALESTEASQARFNRFVIASDSRAIVNRYESAIQPEAKLNIWVKNSRGHWVVEKSINVPSWLIEKVDFRLIE